MMEFVYEFALQSSSRLIKKRFRDKIIKRKQIGVFKNLMRGKRAF